jgi:hypothetical protein
VSDHNSFKAEEGANDDIVMSLVIFAWLTTQRYFREIVTHDIRKQLQLEQMNQMDDETLPIGEFSDGLDVPFVNEGGDLWMDASSGSDPYSGYFRDFFKK